MTACPKPQRIRSKALTASARGRGCTLRLSAQCADGAVFCHVRGKGDGMGSKPPDFWGYFGCQHCHSIEEDGMAAPGDVLRAIRETQTLMAMDGLLSVKGWRP